jgi:NADH-quinone oxidoreductase subunit G
MANARANGGEDFAGEIQIDGRSIPFRTGDTIIHAAHRAGVHIPHYCWHPGLSAPANCRMCLVEIEPPPGRPKLMLDVLRWDPELGDYVPDRKPKLLPACQMECASGMVVHSDASEDVARARSAVQELLLLNHPVDCPICDQAGECDLQDYWLEYQRRDKRMLEEPVHKPKAQIFGEKIVYDAERCIVCTRCIRVCDELAQDHVLDLRERGNRNEIVLAPGRTLDHDYSLMTEHVCPVGALTSSHFRFKARVWFLRSGRTVCQGCATGCNAYLDYDPRDNKPYRYRPRDNEQVNRYWMCDAGMLSYPEAYEDRLLAARDGGEDVGLEEALEAARRQLKGHAEEPARVAIVLSAQHPLEDNFALALLGKRYIGATDFFVARRPDGRGDTILMDADKNPNGAGVRRIAERLALGPLGAVRELVERIALGHYAWAISLGSEVDCDEADAKRQLSHLKGFVAMCTHEGPLASAAHIALPASAWAERVGTYVNRQGLAQRTERVLAPRGESHPAWQLVVALGRALGYELGWAKRRELEVAMHEALERGASAAAPSAAAAGVEVGA